MIGRLHWGNLIGYLLQLLTRLLGIRSHKVQLLMEEWVGGGMSGWTNEWVNEYLNEWLSEWGEWGRNDYMSNWMNEWVSEWHAMWYITNYFLELFQKLFRQDLLVASLYRNYLLAERIMRSYNCTPESHPYLPPTYQHHLWQAWDLVVDHIMAQLPSLIDETQEYEVVHGVHVLVRV